MKTKQNLKLQETYYKALKSSASKKFNTTPSKVGVFGNSNDYKDTVTLTTESMAKYDVAVFVQYSDSSTSVSYAIQMKDLMPILSAWYKSGNKLICDSSCIDQHSEGYLIRVPFEALADYKNNWYTSQEINML